MKKSQLEIGARYGRLIVSEDCGGRPRKYLCTCECGEQKEIVCYQLSSGKTRSCGCLRDEELSERAKTHGQTGTPTYKSWNEAKQRCHNPSNDKYKWYGARGIEMCAKWRSDFGAFIADMGERPEGMTLDRMDVNGNYEPSNCKWATPLEQGANKRNNRILVIGGESMHLSEAARRYGLKVGTIWRRLGLGWTDEQAVKAVKC
ncbi:hypothetical protein ACFIQF_22720 [Comamonas sp. J-3]|uniref:hypothetical protein n=1 Tax=Comamonas trifloxystrobinivorans TaxID=3350256 RepID=UPI003727ACF3